MLNSSETLLVKGSAYSESIINILGSGQKFPPTVIEDGGAKYHKNTGTVDFEWSLFNFNPFFKCTTFRLDHLSEGCPYNLTAGGTE